MRGFVLMKSAYELAIERTGGEPVQKLTEDQKKKIEEIDIVYKAKRAEADLSSQNRLQKVAGNIEEINLIKEDLVVELASINSKMELEKEKIRQN
jgi:hypothetical protein